MNRKQRRADKSKKGKFRLIRGGKVDRPTLAKAALRGQGDDRPPPQRFAEALGVFIALCDQDEKHFPAQRRCGDTDKLAVLMRVACNLAIRLEVPPDQFLDGVQMVYEQQEKIIAEETEKSDA
jgi:hypothetical protein